MSNNRSFGPSVEDIPDIDSLTPNAFQRKWKTPTEFPHCPETADAKNLEEYAARLAFGRLFSRNKYGENITVVAASKQYAAECTRSHEQQPGERLGGD